MSLITEPLALDSTMQSVNASLLAINATLQAGLVPAPVEIKTFADVQRIVRAGLAKKFFSVGDQISCPYARTASVTVPAEQAGVTEGAVDMAVFLAKTRNAEARTLSFTYTAGRWTLGGESVQLSDFGVTPTGAPEEGNVVNVVLKSDTLVWDILDMDYDIPANSEFTHSLSLLLHDPFAYCPADQPELMYWVDPERYPDGLAPGTYAVTLDHGSYLEETTEDGTYLFTTTKPIPAGGGFQHSAIGKYSSSGYTQSKVLAGTFSTYGPLPSRESIETGLATSLLAPEQPSDAVNLGTFTSRTPQYCSDPEHCNYTQRQAHGSNRAAESCIRQWMNSDKATGWWEGLHKFDMPQTSPVAGFLYGLDPQLRAVIGPVRKRTALSVSDGYGFADTIERVFRLSHTEIWGDPEKSVVEGPVTAEGVPTAGPYAYWAEHNTNEDRIKYYGGSARIWWLRSPISARGTSVRSVASSGVLYYDVAESSWTVAVPGLVII